MTRHKEKRTAYYLIPIALAAISMITASAFLKTAEAILIEPAEHFTYAIDTWKWDTDMRRNMGIIKPQIVIENETAGLLEGYVADSRGTRLGFYDGEQVVMVSYKYDNGLRTEWETSGTVDGGNFTIQIPEEHKQADIVRILIGKNHYTVNDGTATTPQTWVFVNTAILEHRLDSTIQGQTQTAVEEKPAAWDMRSSDSLIDRILQMYSSLLPVRSADASK